MVANQLTLQSPAMNSKLVLFLALVAICLVSVVEGQYYSPYYSSYGYGYSPYYGYGGYGYGGYGYGGYYGGYPSYYGGYYGKREAGFAPKQN